ncbi:bifunctional phosphatase PAP2/diacylglycerol kinase family protein [Streptomyces sp. GC420]|uniref:bifunctional phosphatase PAP2/diacylglycerol kinase family protein n=1 Tax=Streptomyces sp. GC420 TaxID=2697568 RepID=UPI001AA0CA4D|nr:bifunctional phosphatase PAP2/diacylglycerol kinase family protein [Streptomyces sp. GC420]
MSAWDRKVFHRVATRDWPGAHPMLPRLSHSANHGLLWFGAAAGMAVLGSPRARRAAARGVVSLGLASLTVNTLGKRSVRRARPVLDHVPLMRQLKRQPITTSFPSGHSASAAAFATGVALESKGWGAAVAPVAAAVAFSRIYTGAHYPSDVMAGMAIGAGAAFAVRGLVPTRSQMPSPGRPHAEVPCLPGGKDVVVVVNSAAGSARAAQVRDALPLAEVVECRSGEALVAELEKAAANCRALGVCGGDGTVNAAAEAAIRHGVPLAVFPGGTLNHFASDLGLDDLHDTCRALASGDAVKVDVGRFTPEPGSGTRPGIFLNTFSLGVYPELVRVRERWSPRIGGWPAGVLAALRVLRGSGPLEAEIEGRRRALWLLFAGNCLYQRVGPAPSRRWDLADGLLDVRVVHGGRLPGVRLLAAAAAGPLSRSPFHAAVRVRELRITGLAPRTPIAYDGEVTLASGVLLVDKLDEALTVYRPLLPA